MPDWNLSPMRAALRLARALDCNFIPTTIQRVPLVEGWADWHLPGTPARIDRETLELWAAMVRERGARGQETAWGLLPSSGRVAVLGGDSEEWTERLLARQPTPLVVRSPTPGRAHLYYRWPEGRDVATRVNAAGVDTYDLKARGATCHMPGSLHKSQRGRYVCDLPLEEIVPGLRERLPVLDLALVEADRVERRAVEWRDSVVGEALLSTDGAGERRLRGYLSKVEPPRRGARENTLFRLGHKAGDFGLDEPRAQALLLPWAARCSPPMGDDEAREVVKRAYLTRYLPIGCDL